MSRGRRLIRSCFGATCIALLAISCPAKAWTPRDSPPSATAAGTRPGAKQVPPHYLATLTTGGSLRIARNSDLGQDRLGPAFFDGFAGYLLSGRTRPGHGFGLGFSLNLTPDGGFTEPVAAAEQWVVMPAYLLYWDLNDDLLLIAHLGLPFQVWGGNKSRGLEAAVGIGYRLSAGTGLYAEATASVYPGAYSTIHPAASLELGVFLDYEVLP